MKFRNKLSLSWSSYPCSWLLLSIKSFPQITFFSFTTHNRSIPFSHGRSGKAERGLESLDEPLDNDEAEPKLCIVDDSLDAVCQDDDDDVDATDVPKSYYS